MKRFSRYGNIGINKLIVQNNIEKSDEELENIINLSIDIIESIEKKKLNTFIYSKSLLWDKLKNNDDIIIFFNFILYLYMDSLNIKLNRKINFMEDYEEIINLIVENNNINDIITKVNKVEELILNLKMNVNSKLIFDKMIIEFSEV